jgi:predicted PhzF superfamily epimerase YddE/YHI9
VIVTAAAMTSGIDFVSRFFAPQSGIPEDPVTGSAHCALGVYWAERLGKSTFVAHPRRIGNKARSVAILIIVMVFAWLGY